MFCKKCGKQLEEGELLCPQCGAPVAEEPVEETVVTEETVQTPVVEEAQTPAEEPVFAQPEFDAPVKKPKKKLGLFAAVIAVVLVCAIVVGAAADPLKGFFLKSFGSDADYLSFVEDKAADDVTDSICEAYGTMLENLGKTQEAIAMDISLQVNVGDKAIDLIETLLSQSGAPAMDFDWLKNISLDIKTNSTGKLEQDFLALKLNGKELANADMITDLDKGTIYVAILSMSEKYLHGDFEMNSALSGDMLNNLSPEELKAVFPAEKTVHNLLNKYQKIILAELQTVTKTTQTVKLGDIEQKLTALELLIDGHTAQKAVLAVLRAAREDEALEKIVKDVAGLLEEKELIDDAEKIYDSFANGISDAIEDVNDAELEDADEAIKLITYVNDAHEIVGREFTFDGTSVRYITVRDGAKFAFELDAAGSAKITGEGTEKKNVVNGKFSIKAGNQNLGDITLTDFCAMGELLNGKITVTPSSELLKAAGLDATGASVISLANPELELVFESAKDSVKMDVNLLTGKELLIGVTLSADEVKTSEIKLPSSDKIYTQEQAQQWLQGLDLEGLVDKLTDAGVPAELLQGLFG